MNIEVKHCARCGENHIITFKKFLRRHFDWTFWGMCPNTQEPVLLKILDF